MGVPTVFIVGTDRLSSVPAYLSLGSVVVVAPDHDTLRSWNWEREGGDRVPVAREVEAGTVVDLNGRRIVTDGGTLPLSDLEYRVLSALLSPPGRAVSFAELRTSGWGEAVEVSGDVYAVRALVQRLRSKLQVAGGAVRISAVRGFGFRAEVDTAQAPHPLATRRPSVVGA